MCFQDERNQNLPRMREIRHCVESSRNCVVRLNLGGSLFDTLDIYFFRRDETP